MRENDVVTFECVDVHIFCERIWRNKRIENDPCTVHFYEKCAVTEVCVGCLDGNESIVKQGVSRFHALQSCTHVLCGQHVDKFQAVVENEQIE